MFQHSLTERTVQVPVSVPWKTVPAVPVPRSVPGKTVQTVPVSGSGSVPGPPCDLQTPLVNPLVFTIPLVCTLLKFVSM